MASTMRSNVWLSSVLSVFASHAALGAGVCASVGNAVPVKDGRGKITDGAARDAAAAAVRQCVSGYATGRPRLIVVIENIRRTRAIAEGVRAAAGGVPFCGVNTAGYASLSSRGFPSKDVPAISALAIGGDALDVQVKRVELPKITGAEYAWALKGEAMYRAAAEHARAGRELLQSFDRPRDGASQLLVVLGTLHNPRQTWFAVGVTANAPKELHVIGGAGADFGSVYHEGASHSNSALGILISGEFSIGVAGEENARDIPRQLAGVMKRAWSQVGSGTPRLALYFGCASWHRQLDAQRETFADRLGETFPLFGQFCGGEIGRLDRGRKVTAKANLAVLAILAPLSARER